MFCNVICKYLNMRSHLDGISLIQLAINIVNACIHKRALSIFGVCSFKDKFNRLRGSCEITK